MTKPFDFDELVARIEALVRREHAFKENKPCSTLQYGGLSIDTESLIVKCEETEIELTTKEREILMLFLTSPNKLLTRERILNAAWGAQEDPLTNVIDVYVGRLRKKLGEYGALIRTVRGMGYRFGDDSNGV